MFDYRLSDDDLIALRKRFNRVYESQVQKPKGESSRVILGALILLVVASVIVSASHTIPAFVETFVGDMPQEVKVGISIAALIMVEVGMLVLAFVLSRRLADVNPEHITKQLKRGLKLAFTLALSANLYSTLKPTFSEQGWWDIASFFVFVLMGLSAPTLAYIAGEVFGLTTLKDERDNAAALAAWEAKRDEAWEVALQKYQRDMVRKGDGRVSVSPDALRGASSTLDVSVQTRQTDRQTDDASKEHGSGAGFSRRSDAVERAVEYLRQNPGGMVLTLRALEDVIGVGKDSINKAKQIIRQEQNTDQS